MRSPRTAVMVFVVLAAVTEAADDQDVAGTCMTCHKESSPGLFVKFFAEEG